MTVTVAFSPEIIRPWQSQQHAVIPVTEDYLVVVLGSLRIYISREFIWVKLVKLSVDDSTCTVTAICNVPNG
jgi:hypothetical protein